MTRPVVFLHGWTMFGGIFAPLIDKLTGIEAHAPDLPGHGSAGQQPAQLRTCVEAVARLINETGRSDVVLVGWSMGALIAWSYIEQFGTDRLSGLVTLDMSPRLVNDPGWSLGLKGQGQSGGRLAASTHEIHSDWPTAAHKIAATMFASRDGAPDMTRAQAAQIILGCNPAAMAMLWDDMLTCDLRSVAALVDIPWLVGYGEHSRVYPATTSEWLAGQGPQAQLMGFASSGHSPHLEQPADVAAAVQAFLDRL